MKDVVHLITTICMGGAEKQLITLIKEQVKSGRQVSVLYLKGIPELEDAIIESGASLVKDFSNLNPVIQFYKIRRHLSKNKDSIVHAHLPRAELATLFLKKGTKIVVTRHNAEKFFPKAPVVVSRNLSKMVVSRTSRVIAISEAVKIFLINSREVIDDSKIQVVYYGFASTPKKSITKNEKIEKLNSFKFLVGTVARLVPQKDLETLIKAFAIFVRQSSGAKLVIVGDGYLKQNLMDLSSNLGIADEIIWFGRTESIPSVIRTMDIFALTSLYEGFGLVLLEAMSEGVPIVASRNSAIPEVLGEEYEGLFATGNEIMLANLFSTVADPKISSRMSRYLTSRMKMFEPHRMRVEIDAVYSSLEIS
jgi:glycosyltransferase involved in cell wall biosynthesis